MSERQDQDDAAKKELAAKNMRLAIMLGVAALLVYVGFILFYMWK